MFLNCHTAFSFKYGTMQVAGLFEEARRCGVHKLILTEINNTASYVELLRICGENEPGSAFADQPHALEIGLGIEFRRDHELLYIALAENNSGFANINSFLSHHNRESKPLPRRAPELAHVLFVYPFGDVEPETLRANEYIGVSLHQRSHFSRLASRHDYPGKFVILHPVTFAGKKDFNVHRLLRAIDLNVLLSKLPVQRQAREDEIMMPEEELAHAFETHQNLIQNTKTLLDRCSIDVKLGEDKNKKQITGSRENDWNVLVTSAREGFQNRYPTAGPSLHERFHRELDIIQRLNFCAYYLIAYNLITFARTNNIDFVGRGSGANSLVAFCLGITNVDPIELDLYFERFLNPERSSPPDFDLDFSWDDRDKIYEYLFRTYGPDHVCLLGTHVTYQKRSILRELAKVFGLPKDEIDTLVDEPERNRHRDHITELVFAYAEKMLALPANLSIHAGGILITEKPISEYTATDMPQKGYPVAHLEMNNAEDLGIFKLDVLSQRGLGHLKETVRHVRRNRGVEVDIHRFHEFKKDDKIKQLLRQGRAMGCFYVESPSMRMLLGKLQCEDYLTLVAASSIIRPGVARSGMMRTYIQRFHAARRGQRYESIHPKMDELMAETFGVMVYQEDVIKVAHHFAGLTLAEADILRRGMSGKFRSRREFERVRDTFFRNCRERGYADTVTQRIWFEIESFSGYSFAKGHSASYAVESYQSLFLKAHYPLEFIVGVINNFGGFYETEFYFHEAYQNGAVVEAPCINHSDYLTTIFGDTIYVGFTHLKSLETKIGEAIPPERSRNGPFKSLEDFLARIDAGLEQMRILIRLGAFRFTGKTKQRLLWESMLYLSRKKERSASANLFDIAVTDSPLPVLQRDTLEDAFDEFELLGFPLGDPFRLLPTSDRGDTLAAELLQKTGQRVRLVGYLVTTKNTTTASREIMHFGTFYDAAGEFFDTVHFPVVAKKHPFRGRGFYELSGMVVEDFCIPTIEVGAMEKLPMVSRRKL